MIKHNQVGAVNGVVVSLILTVLLLIGAIVFGGWAYSGRQDYKNNTDAKISTAVAAAKQKEGTRKDAEFAEAAKNPLKTYRGPEAFGTLTINYPKTWSGYVDDVSKGTALIDGYFAPGVVPSISDENSVFSLRVQVVQEPYSQTLQSLDSPQREGKVTVSAYALPKQPKVVGVLVSGQLDDDTNATMVILPLRSDTLKIWTEGSPYLNDFNNSILPNFDFVP